MDEMRRHEDRLFSREPEVLGIARKLYEAVKDLPIISPHGHVEAEMLALNNNFDNPSELFIRSDHYLTRVLHGKGVNLGDLGVGTDNYDPRKAWGILAGNWHLFLGSPTRYWLEDQMALIFGVDKVLSAETADYVYDQINEKLAGDNYRPRELLTSFGVEYLATTDAPGADLRWHKKLRDENFEIRVAPTFRPDALMNPGKPGWDKQLQNFSNDIGVDINSYSELLGQLRIRREFFTINDGTSTDTGVENATAKSMPEEVIESIFAKALQGSASEEECRLFRENFLYDLIEMASVDGMVMQLHAGVIRNHHDATLESHGPDTGHDLPLATGFTSELREPLNDFGVGTNLRMVLFSVDGGAYARDIAPLAGFYPSIYQGAPWWFLDHPDEIQNIRKATTPHSGFYKTSGFIDDTRALCSIPARHDMSRRVDANFLAEQVATQRISLKDAEKVATDIVTRIPTETFRLNSSFPMSTSDSGMAKAKEKSSVSRLWTD